MILLIPLLVHIRGYLRCGPSCDLHQVARIPVFLQPDETLLDAPRGYKPVEDADTSSLIIRTAAPGASERLLADNSSGTLLVVVHVPGSVAEPVGGLDKYLSVRGEADER